MNYRRFLKGVAAWSILLLLIIPAFAQRSISDTAGRAADKAVHYIGTLNPLQWYEAHTSAANFLLFFMLFFIISYLGLRQAFAENHNAVIVLSITIGLMLAFAAMVAGLGAKFFIPFVKNAPVFILWLALTWILFKSEIIGSKILALVVAGVIVFVAWNMLMPDKDRVQQAVESLTSDIWPNPNYKQTLEALGENEARLIELQAELEKTTDPAERKRIEAGIAKAQYEIKRLKIRKEELDKEEVKTVVEKYQKELDSAQDVDAIMEHTRKLDLEIKKRKEKIEAMKQGASSNAK